MVIYDKNQFAFNLVFILILISSIFLNIYYAANFNILEERFLQVNETLGKVEENQAFNFIQGPHNELQYDLTEHGLLVRSADDYGILSGSSMQPVIFGQHTLIEMTYTGADLEEGQIIRFTRRNGEAVIHRVRADYGSEVYVQGDSLKEGEIINKDQITHIVIGVLYT